MITDIRKSVADLLVDEFDLDIRVSPSVTTRPHDLDVRAGTISCQTCDNHTCYTLCDFYNTCGNTCAETCDGDTCNGPSFCDPGSCNTVCR